MELPTILDDRYQLTERIGEGGMAEVYLGTDIRLKRDIAVKVLRPQYSSDKQFLDRFLDEARAMAGFSHPNIVNVYDAGRERGRSYIVMEYVPGTDLRRLLKERGALPVKDALQIAEQVSQGVAAAHRKGIVHRDIKPGNVLITPDGDVKVADFGIARAVSDSKHLTEPGVVWGTTAYLSPEQIRGDGATPSSDVYSIGVVLYEMLAGSPPFQGEDRVAIALQHLHDAPPRLSERNPHVPRGVEYMIDRAMAKAPEQRFEDADAFVQVLRGYLRAGRESTVPQTAISRPEQPQQAPAQPRESRRRSTTAGAPHRHMQVRSPAPQARAVTPTRTPAQHGSPGIDWFGVALGIIALLMVLGLVPLYALVYQRITATAGDLGGVMQPTVFLAALHLL